MLGESQIAGVDKEALEMLKSRLAFGIMLQAVDDHRVVLVNFVLDGAVVTTIQCILAYEPRFQKSWVGLCSNRFFVESTHARLKL